MRNRLSILLIGVLMIGSIVGLVAQPASADSVDIWCMTHAANPSVSGLRWDDCGYIDTGGTRYQLTSKADIFTWANATGNKVDGFVFLDINDSTVALALWSSSGCGSGSKFVDKLGDIKSEASPAYEMGNPDGVGWGNAVSSAYVARGTGADGNCSSFMMYEGTSESGGSIQCGNYNGSYDECDDLTNWPTHHGGGVNWNDDASSLKFVS